MTQKTKFSSKDRLKILSLHRPDKQEALPFQAKCLLLAQLAHPHSIQEI
ncbi:MAG: hypothetical protein KGH75_09700 [Rhodospirillales bacterium]|nr:hypothetical protein [Rhodospirillales bacterium]